MRYAVPECQPSAAAVMCDQPLGLRQRVSDQRIVRGLLAENAPDLNRRVTMVAQHMRDAAWHVVVDEPLEPPVQGLPRSLSPGVSDVVRPKVRIFVQDLALRPSRIQ